MAVLYRLGSRQDRSFLGVNLAVFAGGTASALVLGALTSGLAWDGATVSLGIFAGVVSVTANVAFLLSVRVGKLAPSWTIFSLALVVPVVLAVFLWREALTWQRVGGVAATVAAVILVGMDMAGSRTSGGEEGGPCGDG